VFFNGFMGNYGDPMFLFNGFMGNYGDPMFFLMVLWEIMVILCVYFMV
jgi:hypothetical protein